MPSCLPGQPGLLTSHETTGLRAMLGLRARPGRSWPYAKLGIVYNHRDVETMTFDHRPRTFGDGQYDTGLVIQQTRPAGAGLALGFGYEVEVTERLAAHVDIALALLADPPVPELEFRGVPGLNPRDVATATDRLEKAFMDNIHNRYHLFSIGAGWRFE